MLTTHNFYIKQYCYESTPKVDNKTVIFFSYKVAYCVVCYCLYFKSGKGFIIYAINKKISECEK